MDAEQLTGAVMGRKAVYNAAWRFFRTYDLLLTPTLAVPPFEHGIQGPAEIGGRIVERFYWLSFTFPFNLTGQPAAAVPAGWTADGLPVGLQIAGRRLDDPAVLRAAAASAGLVPAGRPVPALAAAAAVTTAALRTAQLRHCFLARGGTVIAASRPAQPAPRTQTQTRMREAALPAHAGVAGTAAH
jgi:Amidase